MLNVLVRILQDHPQPDEPLTAKTLVYLIQSAQQRELRERMREEIFMGNLTAECTDPNS